ncbi:MULTISPECIES: ImmA/IrrE family metallo-endopeptidase [unclassified Microbacterium]|uniref:ImmA/IrrE family metallo-endopeptidase n=1 Tax=unclassified Microbacterium TaxID=2609290 RepID=UPI003669C009
MVAHDLGEARVTRLPDRGSVEEAAAAIIEDLRFTVTDRARMSREDARNHLRHAFEQLGGIAVFTTMVGNDNHRMLDRDEFRGFALADPFAPLIFVTAHDDSLSGQIFTFLHEYVQVARSESGVGDEEGWDVAAQSDIECWCNAVASDALVPRADLRAQFDSSRELPEMLEQLARRYLASTLTILIHRPVAQTSSSGPSSLSAIR